LVILEELDETLGVSVPPHRVFCNFCTAHRTCPFSVEPYSNAIFTKDMLQKVKNKNYLYKKICF